jgi:beta-carotene hydroxylase
MVLHAYAMYTIPAAAAYLVLVSALPVVAKILLIPPFAFLAGIGLHTIGYTGHEALHLNLHRNRFLGFALGLVVNSVIVGHYVVGFAVSHWNHHRFTNDENDPDHQLYADLRSLGRRLLFARARASSTYVRSTIKTAFGIDLGFKYKFPLKPWQLVFLAWENLILQTTALVVALTLTWHFPLPMLACYWAPFVVLYMYSGLRPFFEHAATDAGIPVDSRSRTSPLITFLEFGNNFHLEHHLYPNVPCYKLPRLHRELSALDFYKDNDVKLEPSFWKFAKYALSGSQYQTHQLNQPIDVFDLRDDR